MLHVATSNSFSVGRNGSSDTFSNTSTVIVTPPIVPISGNASTQYLTPLQYHLMNMPDALLGPPTTPPLSHEVDDETSFPEVSDAGKGDVTNVYQEDGTPPVIVYATNGSDVNPDPRPIYRLSQEDVSMRPSREDGLGVVLAQPSELTGKTGY